MVNESGIEGTYAETVGPDGTVSASTEARVMFCMHPDMCGTLVDESDEMQGSIECLEWDDTWQYAGAKKVAASIVALGALMFSAI